MKNRKLAIMVPWDSHFVWTKAVFNLMNLDRPDGYEVRFIQGDGWCPANRHNNCVIRALNWGADILVFMGADHYVDEDCMQKLVHHIDDRGYDAACGWIPSRGVVGVKGKADAFPYKAWKKKPGQVIEPGAIPVIAMREKEWDALEYGAESQEIHVIGTGMLAFKREIPFYMERPWFKEIIEKNDQYGRVPAQDAWFVYRMTCEHGFSLWLDTTIGMKHLDVFPIDETYRERFKDFKDPDCYSPHSKLGGHPYERTGNPALSGDMQQSEDAGS